MINGRLLQHPLGCLLLRLSLGPVPGLLLAGAEDGEDQEFSAEESGGQVEDGVPRGQARLQSRKLGNAENLFKTKI